MVTEMAREREKRAGDSAYSKCKTATAESSDRDDNENTDAKSSPGEMVEMNLVDQHTRKKGRF